MPKSECSPLVRQMRTFLFVRRKLHSIRCSPNFKFSSCCKCCCLLIVAIILFIAGSMGMLAAFFPYPSHASCRVDWVFRKSCSSVEESLVHQIKGWSEGECDLKQQCQYEYLGKDDNVIRGKHITPSMKYVDSFNFTFTRGGDGGCHVLGISESDAWYATLDFGTNYCNLKNLITGAKILDEDEILAENSDNEICTMYSLAFCNFYAD